MLLYKRLLGNNSTLAPSTSRSPANRGLWRLGGPVLVPSTIQLAMGSSSSSRRGLPLGASPVAVCFHQDLAMAPCRGLF